MAQRLLTTGRRSRVRARYRLTPWWVKVLAVFVASRVVSPPARIERTARIDASLVSAGAVVRGTVESSVVGPGVVVDEGAEVRESVLLHDSVIAAGAPGSRAIVDAEARGEEGGEVGAAEEIAVGGA